MCMVKKIVEIILALRAGPINETTASFIGPALDLQVTKQRRDLVNKIGWRIIEVLMWIDIIDWVGKVIGKDLLK